jgi:hypothetical protein
MKKAHNEVSKFLSYVLRHQPEAIGLELDSEGWANIDALIAGAAGQGQSLDKQLIEAVVDGSDKSASPSPKTGCVFVPFRGTRRRKSISPLLKKNHRTSCTTAPPAVFFPPFLQKD